ncbi:2-octaprenyl-6-methoxyphenyl hydroxylase [Xanthomonas sp. AmX2]|uniref:2-octaprenyl-6-methoxyphenyl hydroxylase n=1 Tax=Xanthomonas sp. TaxID=29446 RepID=UPI0019800D8D|nr:2-octaprenyl-6-methoxyphenyl hydroxylase [Xanthomonas sp.]MBN6149923.1 2-octaprenyl-6-methoxyphenyl hydroxylase [Xanthomonas sp.]
MSKRHDVVIVGGGLVGASLAIALDRLGVDVGLVEAAPPGALPPVFDQRNLSFAAATVNALSALGVMQRLRAPTGPIRRIHVSRAGDFGRVRLDAADYGREAFGQVVVARDFGEALEARLAELRSVTRYRPAQFLGLDEDGDDGLRRVRIAHDGATQVLESRLLVGADGTASAVRAALGIGANRHDFRQTLFVARVRGSRQPDGTAYERFRDDGPTALLPRGDRHYGAVHAVAAEQADAVAALDEAAWLQRLQDALGWRVGRLLGSGERSAYPIVQVLAERLTGARAVLLGNAAQTLHPLGAQGFNLGLRDALTLAESIEQADDAGAPALLQRYAQRREQDRQRTVTFSGGLARLTANPAPLLRPLRSVGLLAAAQAAPLQSFLVGGAMGFRGDVPQLCRGAGA